MAFRPRGGRPKEFNPVFHKGRRPRRTIKSAGAKAGLRRLRLVLIAIAGLAVLCGGWLHWAQSAKRDRTAPAAPALLSR